MKNFTDSRILQLLSVGSFSIGVYNINSGIKFRSMIQRLDKLNEHIEILKTNQSNAELTQKYLEEQGDSMSNSIIQTQDSFITLIEIISGGNSSVSSSFMDKSNELFNKISSLSLDESIALVHLSGCLVIFISLVSLVGVFYGKFLIEYFKLGERYPKIKKFLDLRLKFQQYYLLFDFFLISFILVGIVYVNILILYHK